MLRRFAPYFPGVMVAIAAGLAYANSLRGPFVFDDLGAIRDNPTMRAPADLRAVLHPPANSGVGGRPFANLSFALNRALGGASPAGFHLGNVVLHTATALLLLGLVRRTPGASDGLAGTIALLWAVHPLATAAVTYLSQRTELLAAFGQLATLYAFVRGWRFLSVLACLAGVLSKEVAATAPLLVLLYDRTFVAGSWRHAWSERRGYYLALGASWLVTAALLTTGLAQRNVGFGLGVSPLDYALTEARAVLLYLKLALWPAPLVFDYGPIYPPFDFATLASVGAVGGALLWAAREVGRGSAAGFLAGGFFLLLAPTSSLVPVAVQPVAENRMYLPLACVIAAGAMTVQSALRPRRAVWAAAALALGILTALRNETYRSELALWHDTVAKRPENSRAVFNLGVAALAAGRVADADTQFRRAVVMAPGDPRAHHGLGTVLLRRGGLAGAGVEFAAALRLDPAFVEAHAGLGDVRFKQGNPAAAIAHYEAALRLDPARAEISYSCGNACLEVGRVAEGVGHFAAAVAARPDEPRMRNAYGAALVQAGRGGEAVAQFEAALRLSPDYSDARHNLETVRAALAGK